MRLVADLQPFALCLTLLLASATCPGAEAGTTPVPDGGKAEVRLPEVRSVDWQVLPYFRIEGEKAPTAGALTVESPSEQGRFELEPHVKTEHPAGTNARWNTDFSVSFMPDATQTALVRARDTAVAGYRFDDKLFWTEFQHKTQIRHGLDCSTPERIDEMADRFGAGHRFQWVDWALSVSRDERSGDAPGVVRHRRDERLWLQLKTHELIRPGFSIERRDVDMNAPPADLVRRDVDGEIFSLNASGAWGRRLSWRSSWSAEQIANSDWAPASVPASSDWDRSSLDTGITWLPWNNAPKLDFSFSQESGYETEQRYQETSNWKLQAGHQLTTDWQAQVSTGVQESTDLQGHDARTLNAGVGTSIRLGYRAQLSGSYQYMEDEADRSKPADSQIRLQFKMKW